MSTRDLLYVLMGPSVVGTIVNRRNVVINHAESFQSASSVVTSRRVIPEWFVLILFGAIKCVPDRAIELVVLLVCISAVAI